MIPFTNEQAIIGFSLLDFVRWTLNSEHNLTNGGGCLAGGMPMINLTPMQRTSVWRPKQVADLWDSLMRGLPIGTFYLVERTSDERAVASFGGKSISIRGGGFELLDGQQRVRALWLGFREISDERCLWVDLGADTAEHWPCLRVTSKSQPFGYDATTGGKLRLDERRSGRARIEPCPKHHPIIFTDLDGQCRRAYDLDLFDGTVKQDEKTIVQPPMPYGASSRTFTLNKLLSAWQDGGIKSVSSLASGISENALSVLDKAFNNINRTQVVLLRISPDSLYDHSNDLLKLFERVGAGGTPLSAEERLFSIYKYHVPKVRDAVSEIYRAAGRVLPPTKIVSTALRIANANRDRPAYSVPDVTEFSERMLETPPSDLRRNLESLLPIERGNYCGQISPLHHIFPRLACALAYSEDAGPFWIPDILLAELHSELWQVLVFWAHRRRESTPDGTYEITRQDRQDLVRFSLFWHLCIWNHDKAASWCFSYIRQNEDAITSFPGGALYRLLCGIDSGEACGSALMPSDEFSRRLCHQERSSWRSDHERFGNGGDRNGAGAHWWWNGEKLLPWLQRDYIRRAFPGYAPLTNHEDDLPYDVDHICPQKDCRDWWSVRDRVDVRDPALRQAMRDGRDALCNGIGNLRLIDSSLNRSDHDDDVATKLPFICSDHEPTRDERTAMVDFGFACQNRNLWKRVSRPGKVADRQWDEDRLQAFQQSVEQRAIWLYRRFYDDLGYGAWGSSQSSDEG